MRCVFARLTLVVIASCLFYGCMSGVHMESYETSAKMKSFPPPSAGNSGLYIYRGGSLGGSRSSPGLKKDVWVDNRCVGELAGGVFFYEEVRGNMAHKVSTESEFSPNHLVVNTFAGQNHFVKQYIKPGAFVNGADLELVATEEGMRDVRQLEMALKGLCENPYP